MPNRQILEAPHQHMSRTADWRALVQFVYDVWYGQLTPDHDFPAEVRGVLNHAFGELAARARHVDIRDMLLL